MIARCLRSASLSIANPARATYETDEFAYAKESAHLTRGSVFGRGTHHVRECLQMLLSKHEYFVDKAERRTRPIAKCVAAGHSR